MNNKNKAYAAIMLPLLLSLSGKKQRGSRDKETEKVVLPRVPLKMIHSPLPKLKDNKATVERWMNKLTIPKEQKKVMEKHLRFLSSISTDPKKRVSKQDVITLFTNSGMFPYMMQLNISDATNTFNAVKAIGFDEDIENINFVDPEFVALLEDMLKSWSAKIVNLRDMALGKAEYIRHLLEEMINYFQADPVEPERRAEELRFIHNLTSSVNFEVDQVFGGEQSLDGFAMGDMVPPSEEEAESLRIALYDTINNELKSLNNGMVGDLRNGILAFYGYTARYRQTRYGSQRIPEVMSMAEKKFLERIGIEEDQSNFFSPRHQSRDDTWYGENVLDDADFSWMNPELYNLLQTLPDRLIAVANDNVENFAKVPDDTYLFSPSGEDKGWYGERFGTEFSEYGLSSILADTSESQEIEGLVIPNLKEMFSDQVVIDELDANVAQHFRQSQPLFWFRGLIKGDTLYVQELQNDHASTFRANKDFTRQPYYYLSKKQEDDLRHHHKSDKPLVLRRDQDYSYDMSADEAFFYTINPRAKRQNILTALTQWISRHLGVGLDTIVRTMPQIRSTYLKDYKTALKRSSEKPNVYDLSVNEFELLLDDLREYTRASVRDMTQEYLDYMNQEGFPQNHPRPQECRKDIAVNLSNFDKLPQDFEDTIRAAVKEPPSRNYDGNSTRFQIPPTDWVRADIIFCFAVAASLGLKKVAFCEALASILIVGGDTTGQEKFYDIIVPNKVRSVARKYNIQYQGKIGLKIQPRTDEMKLLSLGEKLLQCDLWEMPPATIKFFREKGYPIFG